MRNKKQKIKDFQEVCDWVRDNSVDTSHSDNIFTYKIQNMILKSTHIDIESSEVLSIDERRVGIYVRSVYGEMFKLNKVLFEKMKERIQVSTQT